VQALPDLTNEVPQAVPANYGELFFVYFRYGNPTAQTVMPNLSTKLEISGQGFRLVPDQIYDLYYPQEGNQTIPQVPLCSNEYSGLDYQISPNLVQDNQLIYGPQSARVVLEPSGNDVSEIPPRSAGCLRVGLKVSPEAVPGQTTTLTFNPDLNNSAPELSPGQQTLTLVVGENLNCPEGQDLVQGSCQPQCVPGELRNRVGICVSLDQICGPNKELFEGKCVPACVSGQARDAQGECVSVTGGFVAFLSQIWTVPLILVAGILAWFGGKYVYHRWRQMRPN
jgi:hypothetical protein